MRRLVRCGEEPYKSALSLTNRGKNEKQTFSARAGRMIMKTHKRSKIMSKSKKSGIAPLIVMLAGFLIGLFIGRGIEINDDDNDDEDDLF